MAPVGTNFAAPQAAPGGGLRSATSFLLIASTVLMGLMAGLFWAYDISVMPGLGDSDDRTFIIAMQHFNADIENGLFALVFAGAFLLPAVGAALALALRNRAAAVWTAVAVIAYFVVLALTMGISVPLNNKLGAAGPVEHITDLHKVRADFEGVWVTVNHFRTLLTTVAVAALGRALALLGRTRTAPQHPPVGYPGQAAYMAPTGAAPHHGQR